MCEKLGIVPRVRHFAWSPLAPLKHAVLPRQSRGAGGIPRHDTLSKSRERVGREGSKNRDELHSG